jgi:hypothetical protein
MWHVGIDLHRLSVVIVAVDDEGNSFGARRIDCQDRPAILETMRSLQPFRAVIEATGTYRWARGSGAAVAAVVAGPGRPVAGRVDLAARAGHRGVPRNFHRMTRGDRAWPAAARRQSRGHRLIS